MKYDLVRLVNALLAAKREGDVVKAKVLEDMLAELQYAY